MIGKDKRFTELSKAQIQEKRNVVISLTDRNEIALGQQVIIEEKQRPISVFLKGAIFVDRERLVDLRDALNEAILYLDSGPDE